MTEAEEMRALAAAYGCGGKRFPQETESNEYRYISASWLNAVAAGLTEGQVKYPGETWRQIPPEEHMARAMRHINLWRMGDRGETHIINASMRLMMAFDTDSRKEWERKLHEKQVEATQDARA